MKSLLYILIIFSSPLCLIGMDGSFEDKMATLTHAQNRYLTIAKRSLTKGIAEFKKGNTKTAGIMLIGAYYYAERNDLFDYIESTIVRQACNLISISQADSGNLKRAFEFSNKVNHNNTDKGIIYRHLAKNAHDKGNFILEQEYYKKAFGCFQSFSLQDTRAAHYYQDALYKEIGCSYSLALIRTHHLEQVKARFSQRIEGILEKPYEKALKELLQFAEHDIKTQCIITALYINEQEAPKYGLPFSYDKGLEWCKKVITNIAQTLHSSMILPQLLAFPLTMEKLCSHKDYEKETLILNKYLTILLALKNKNTINLETLQPLTEPFSLTVAKIMSLQIDDSVITNIHSIFFDDHAFKQFCNTEGELAIPILRSLLQNTPMDQKLCDMFHFIIGGYEYCHNNFDQAEGHLSRISYYEKDIYLQTINLPLYISENNKKKLRLFFSLFRKNLYEHTTTLTTKKAKEIIVQLCNHKQCQGPEDTLSFCEQFLLKFVASPAHIDPREQLRFFIELAQLYHQATKYDNLAKKSSIIQLYFDFFSALFELDQQKLTQLLFSPAVLSIKGRATLFKTFCNNKKDMVKQFILEDKTFKELCIFDSFILRPLLQQIVATSNPLLKIKPSQCHYLLGGIDLIDANFEQAKKHFLACDEYKNDLYLQAQILKVSSTDKSCIEFLKALPQTLAQSPKNERSSKAIQLLNETCNQLYSKYTEIFLLNKEYTAMYDLLHAGISLTLPLTYPILCQALLKTEISLSEESPENYYVTLLNNSTRLRLFATVEKLIEQKNHDACWCNCFAHMYENCLQKSIAYPDEYIGLQTNRLHYLNCSLKHDVDKENAQTSAKKFKCGEIAYELGVCTNSFDLLTRAIAYGNEQALRAKAKLLSTLPPTAENTTEYLYLLKQHILTNEPERALSLEDLGKYYNGLPGIENEQNAFSYFQKAAELNNKNVEKELMFFYLNGIKEQNGTWYLEPDRKKAIKYATEIIEHTRTDLISALYIRAQIYYAENELEKASADLISLLNCTLSKGDTFTTLWFLVCIKIVANEDLDNIIASLRQLNNIWYESDTLKKKLTIDTQTLKIIQNKTNDIIDNSITDDASLEFCYLIGSIFFDPNQTNKEVRNCFIKCLEYASKHNLLEAQLILATIDDIKLCDRIYYLEESLQNNPSLENAIQPMLNSLYPKWIIVQAGLLIYFNEKNVPIVLKYLSQPGHNYTPFIHKPGTFTNLTTKDINNLVNDFTNIEVIKKNADSFVEKMKKSKKEVIIHPTNIEYFSALISGSLFCYSDNISQLITGACYLDACYQYNSATDEHIRTNLGYIYYKLGLIHTKKPHEKPILALIYLQKACTLQNIESSILLSDLWLEGKIDRKKISSDTIKEYLNAAQRIEPENTKISQALQRHQPTPLPSPIPQINSNLKTLIDLDTQRKHSTYPLLVCNPEIFINCQSLTFSSLNIEESSKLQIYNQLAHKQDPDPYAYFYLVLSFISTQKHKDVKNYICKGLENSIITVPNKINALFKCLVGLNLFSRTLCAIIESNISEKWTFLSIIKRKLQTELINLVAFEEYFESFCNKDLHKYSAWNSKK